MSFSPANLLPPKCPRSTLDGSEDGIRYWLMPSFFGPSKCAMFSVLTSTTCRQPSAECAG